MRLKPLMENNVQSKCEAATIARKQDSIWRELTERLRGKELTSTGMKRLWGRKVSNLAFGDFMLKMHWQVKKRGKRVETIGRWETTMPVSHECGQRHALIDLSVRDWYCQSCKIQHDRDLNAAINILKIGTATLFARASICNKVANGNGFGIIKDHLQPPRSCAEERGSDSLLRATLVETTIRTSGGTEEPHCS